MIDKKGFITISDNCVGAGSMLIAAVDALKELNVDYQNHAFFVGNDIDPTVAKMAYIQLSLLGCAGYISINDELLNPISEGTALMPVPNKDQDIWYMPMYFNEVWTYRKFGQKSLGLYK